MQYCGFLWHDARQVRFRWADFPTRAAFYQPRFGMAYALNENTVLRGGWGRYYYHSAQFTTSLNVSAGVQAITLEQQSGPEQYPADGQPARHAELQLAGPHDRARSTAPTIGSRGRTAIASRFRSACRGPGWLRLHTSETRRGTCSTRRRRGQRHQHGSGGIDAFLAERRSGSEHTERQQLPSACKGSRGSGAGHKQPLRQLQFAAGQVHAHARQGHHRR